MIALLITAIFWLILGGVIWWLISMLPLDDKIKQVIKVLLIVIAILFVVGVVYGTVPVLPMLR